MNIIDRLFAGKVVKDFGYLELQSIFLGKTGRRVLLVEKRGELFFVIKSFAWAAYGGSCRYFTLRLANVLKLREFIDIGEQVALELVPLDSVKGRGRLFVGQVVRDLGCLEQERFPTGSMRKCALLAVRAGELHLVLTFSLLAMFGWNVAYQYFGMEDARRLRGFIDESERIAVSLPPSTYDPRVDVALTASATALVTAGIALLPTGMLSIVVFLVLLMNCVHRIQVFRRFAETRIYGSSVMTFLALCILVVAGIKLALAAGL